MDDMFCTSAIYSENYVNLLVEEDNELVSQNANPTLSCYSVVTGRYGIGYRPASENGSYELGMIAYENIPKCYGLMDDLAIEATGVDRLSILPGVGVTGKGVLIGFVDTGIDYTNPIFRDVTGSRIRYIWDQTEEAFGTGSPYMGYGAEYDKALIDRALNADNPYDIVPEKDDNGHGTFMASLAAGAISENEDFRGMAPSAEIIVVKLKRAKNNLRNFYKISENADCYGEDDIILGVKYLLDKATELAMPLVICLGLGSSFGNHNGGNALDVYLREFINLRGLAVVVAAGNELGYSSHYQGKAIDGNTSINSQSYDANNRVSDRIEINVVQRSEGFSVELWGKAPGIIKATVVSPTGERFSDIPYARDGGAEKRFLYEGTTVYAYNTVVDTMTGDQVIFFRFENVTEGLWNIDIENYEDNLSSGFDAWLPIKAFLDTDITFVKSEPNVTICAPGNSRAVITVAGYNQNNGAIYYRSGRGYTRSGEVKPDITAPAVSIKGAFATNNGRELYIESSGSSVSAALVAGGVALIMDWALVQGFYPVITTEVVKQMLIRGAKYTNDLQYPNRIWGYGVVDFFNTFEKLRN